MNVISPSTYSAAAETIKSLRNLRKVKLFPRVSAVTVVTYSIDERTVSSKTPRYIGRARTLDLRNLRTMTVELEHSSNLPPPVATQGDNEADEEIEIDPVSTTTPRLPAIGV